jgi:hypothetical protein
MVFPGSCGLARRYRPFPSPKTLPGICPPTIGSLELDRGETLPGKGPTGWRSVRRASRLLDGSLPQSPPSEGFAGTPSPINSCACRVGCRSLSRPEPRSSDLIGTRFPRRKAFREPRFSSASRSRAWTVVGMGIGVRIGLRYPSGIEAGWTTTPAMCRRPSNIRTCPSVA